MIEDPDLPTIDILKVQAKRLRARLAMDGDTISHSKALELVARQQGFKDWNTLSAAARTRPAHKSYTVGSAIQGAYRGKPFTGQVVGIQRVGVSHRRLTIEFDEPVDVVDFDSFSAFRRRVTDVVNANGVSNAKLSNGVPYLRLDADRGRQV